MNAAARTIRARDRQVYHAQPGREPDGPRASEATKQDVVLDCGWGRLLFAQTFSDDDKLLSELREEAPSSRDIAFYVRDPHDVTALSQWVFETLAALSRRHDLSAIVTAGHGSGGVLTGTDPDAGDGATLPMIDYEQSLPPDILDGYTPLAGSFLDRGSATMHAQ